MNIGTRKIIGLLVAITMLFNYGIWCFAVSDENLNDARTMKNVKNLNDVPGFNYLQKDNNGSSPNSGGGQTIKPQNIGVISVVLAAAALIATIYQTYTATDFPTANNWLVNNVKTDGYVYNVNGNGTKEMIEIKLSGGVYDHRTTGNWAGGSYQTNHVVVYYIENYLKRANAFAYTPDMIYNSNTNSAVKNLQSKHYISQDGIVGRVTYEHMVNWR